MHCTLIINAHYFYIAGGRWVSHRLHKSNRTGVVARPATTKALRRLNLLEKHNKISVLSDIKIGNICAVDSRIFLTRTGSPHARSSFVYKLGRMGLGMLKILNDSIDNYTNTMNILMICDYCGDEFVIKKQTYKLNHTRYHKDACKKCVYIKQRDRRIFECGVDNLLAQHKVTGRNISGNFYPISGEQAYELFDNYNITILFNKEDYITSDTKLPFICNIHNEDGIQYKNWLQAKRKNGSPICRSCVLEYMKNKYKFSYDFVKEEFNKKGYVLLTDNYKNVFQDLDFICEKHQDKGIQTVRFTSIRYSTYSCLYCLSEHRLTSLFESDERSLLMNKREYKNWRKFVLYRDNFQCQSCGEINKKLNVHHLYGFREYVQYRLSNWNGITLCEKCHNEFHVLYGKKHFYPEDLYEYMQKYQSGEFDKIE